MAGAEVTPGLPARWAAWVGYMAAVLALLSAATSFYWAAGGSAGLATIGGEIARLGRARDPALIAVVWGAGVAKVVAGVLALALVRPWGRIFPRWLLLAAAWGASALLTVWGGLNVVAGGLALAGVVAAPASADWTALRWHVFWWDPWFLVWGLLLGAAAWGFRREPGGQPILMH
ncbi:MAG TPA: DUF3995 domain-containing protein [Thermomicrobiales bacterium]|nr:DUF3995 domain-containing protein [Thermomicrobiales bacterium]